MKKILSVLVPIGFLATLLVPMITLAQVTVTPVTSCTITHKIEGAGFTCPTTLPATCSYDSTAYTCASCCLVEKIYSFTDWFFLIAIALAIIFAIWGGFLLMTAAGEPEKVAKGRQWVMWAGVGIAVALLAKATPGLVKAIIA